MDRSIGSILQDIVGNVQSIVRSEVRLAKTEIREEASAAGSALVRTGIGAGVAFFAAFFLLLGVVYALSLRLPLWMAAASVGIVLAIVGGLLISSGLRRFKRVDFVPDQTIQSVKEQVAWPKAPSK